MSPLASIAQDSGFPSASSPLFPLQLFVLLAVLVVACLLGAWARKGAEARLRERTRAVPEAAFERADQHLGARERVALLAYAGLTGLGLGLGGFGWGYALPALVGLGLGFRVGVRGEAPPGSMGRALAVAVFPALVFVMYTSRGFDPPTVFEPGHALLLALIQGVLGAYVLVVGGRTAQGMGHARRRSDDAFDSFSSSPSSRRGRRSGSGGSIGGGGSFGGGGGSFGGGGASSNW